MYVVEGFATRLELDEEVEIARLLRIAAGMRAEEAEAPDSQSSKERLVAGEGLEDSVSRGHYSLRRAPCQWKIQSWASGKPTPPSWLPSCASRLAEIRNRAVRS